MKYLLSFVSVLIVFTFFGCGNSAEDYLNEAAENLKNEKPAEAVALYEKIVEEYPESEQAPEALYQMATIYQSALIPNYSKEESLRKAISSFTSVYEKYPENKYAPVSLFMSGFIQANELQNFDDATKTYNLFLQKYPKHELSSSARQELENMGLAPDEILKKSEPVI